MPEREEMATVVVEDMAVLHEQTYTNTRFVFRGEVLFTYCHFEGCDLSSFEYAIGRASHCYFINCIMPPAVYGKLTR